jgi:hypothetical protein
VLALQLHELLARAEQLVQDHFYQAGRVPLDSLLHHSPSARITP